MASRRPDGAALLPVIAIVLALAIAATSCSRRQPAEPQARGPSAATTPVCRTEAVLTAEIGRVCTVIGTYEMKTFPGKGSRAGGGASLGDWPIVKLADGTRVMIESIWDASKKPDAEEIRRFLGEQVEVAGELHRFPPRGSPQNFFFHTISPVERIRIVDR